MSELANLELKVTSDAVELASKRLDAFAKAGEEAGRSSDGFMTKAVKFGSAALAGIVTVESVKKILEIRQGYADLITELDQATGSADRAHAVFKVLDELGDKGPFTTKQWADAFSDLRTRGLEPSEKALTAYGNIASKFRVDLAAVTSVVEQASIGQVRGLSQFAIHAVTSGSSIELTFNGITTKVRNSSKAIQDYLINLGSVNFAGAMTKQMTPLSLEIKQLQSQFEALFRGSGDAATSSPMITGVHLLKQALQELNGEFNSGRASGYLQALSGEFKLWTTDARSAITIVASLWETGSSDMNGRTQSVGKELRTVFAELPIIARTGIQSAVTEVMAAYQKADAYVTYILNKGQRAQVEFKAGKFVNTTDESSAEALQKRLDQINYTRQSSLKDIGSEAKASLDSFHSQISAADKLREVYDKQKKAEEEAAAGTDRLKGMSTNKNPNAINKDEGAKALASQMAALMQELNKENNTIFDAYTKREDKIAELTAAGSAKRRKLQAMNDEVTARELFDNMLTEEQKVEESYKKRQEVIAVISEEGSAQREKLQRMSLAQFAKENADVREAKEAELKTVSDFLLTEEGILREAYEKRRKIVEEDTTHPELYAASMKALKAKEEQEISVLRESKQQRLESLDDYYATDLQKLLVAQRQRREAILLDTQLTESQKQMLLAKEQKRALQEQASFQLQQAQETSKSASAMFGSLSDIAKKHGGEQSQAYAAMFAVSKGFAIAESTMSIAAGAANALKLGWPAGIAAGAEVLAEGASLMATIYGANYAGAYDIGGRIPSGGVGVVGEYGPEFVRGPAQVTSRRDTAAQLKQQGRDEASSGAPPTVNLRLVNAPDTNGAHKYNTSAQGERSIMNVVRKNGSTIRQLTIGGR